MPTGIEEAVAAIASLIVDGLIASGFSGTADPNQGGFAAGVAAQDGPSPLLSPDLLEGQSSVCQTVTPSGAGGAQTPANGDHLAPNIPDQAPQDPADSPMRVVEMAPALVVVARPQAAGSPVVDAPVDAVRDHPDPLVPFVPPPANYAPPLWNPAPAAGEAETAAPDFDLPSAEAPPASPDGGWHWTPPADYADAWERDVPLAPSNLLFGKSGESSSRDIKVRAENTLSDVLFDPDDLEVERLAKVAIAGAIQSAVDFNTSLFIVPNLDPAVIVRGYMRTGATSSQGADDIEQGKTLVGTTKIVGEVSGIVLNVLTPIRGFVDKGPTPTPGEPSITVFLEKGGRGPEKFFGHNKVQIETGTTPRETIVTDARHDITNVTLRPDGTPAGGEVVSRARDYPSLKDPIVDSEQASYTRPVTAKQAADMVAAVDRALASNYGGVKGGIGPWSVCGEQCSVYASSIARAGGFVVSGRFGPHVTYLMFKYFGELGFANAAAPIVDAAVVNNAYTQPANPP